MKGLSNGTSYKFLVQAWNGSSWSPFSESDLVACRPSDPRAPGRGRGDRRQQVTVSWKAVAGAERYAVAEKMADSSSGPTRSTRRAPPSRSPTSPTA